MSERTLLVSERCTVYVVLQRDFFRSGQASASSLAARWTSFLQIFSPKISSRFSLGCLPAAALLPRPLRRRRRRRRRRRLLSRLTRGQSGGRRRAPGCPGQQAARERNK